jgi:glyoxylase-like metal-dependent hydrolase (beta-lactamase superfamily II)
LSPELKSFKLTDGMPPVNDEQPLPAGVACLPLAVPFLHSINVWLLEGEPLTIVDTGPGNRETLASLEAQLRARSRAVEDVELILLTHHHLDHTGLAGRIAERSGAIVAASEGTTAWGRDYQSRAAEERRFGVALQLAHGVPARLVQAGEPFWEHIERNSADFPVTRVVTDGDVVVAGGRRLRVVERPGHSATDTLFVDDASGVALVGDHLLADITSGAEVVPSGDVSDGRRRSLVEYLDALRETASMPLEVLLTGHGPPIRDHRSLIAERLAFHESRLTEVAALVEAGFGTAFEVARRLWDDEVAETQTVLAVWEVVGHLDVLVGRGIVFEDVDSGGTHVFRATQTVAAP